MGKSINHVTLLGNLGQDPEVKYTPKGTPVARLSLATNSRYKDKAGNWQDQTEWHKVILWARLAEIAGEYLKKCSKVAITGELRTRSWADKNHSDVKHYSTEIVGNNLIMLDAKADKVGVAKSDADESAGQITDDDIPF